MSIRLLLKSVSRFFLAYVLICILCSILIVIGNDVLMHTNNCNTPITVLQVDFVPWLRVCAMVLLTAFAVCHMSIYLFRSRLSLMITGIGCGVVTLCILTLSGIWSFTTEPDMYATKNLIVFFLSGFGYTMLIY